MQKLHTVLFNKDGGYNTPQHYKTFVRSEVTNDEFAQNSRRTTFLTYEDLLKVIYH
jgi:hypothetical protein